MKVETAANVTEKNLGPIIDKSRSPKRRCERPMKKCSACILCGYNETDVSYHRFPTNKTKKEWLRLCDLPESTNTRSLKICGRHFAENQKWYAADGSVRLNYGAVPGLNLEIYGLSTGGNESSSLDVQQSRNRTADEPPFETTAVSYSESSAEVNLENNFNLKNTMNIELVEVVEMKIYRYNSLPTAGTLESCNIISQDIEQSSPTSVNHLENESNTWSKYSMGAKGLEMHSYSKPVSESTENPAVANKEPQSMRRFKALRYFGDLQKEDFASPDTAKHSWHVAKKLIEKRNEKILSLEEENEKLVKRLKNLKEILRQLRMTGSIPPQYRKNIQVKK